MHRGIKKRFREPTVAFSLLCSPYEWAAAIWNILHKVHPFSLQINCNARYSEVLRCNLCCSNCTSSVLCGTETITRNVVLQKVISRQPVNSPYFMQAGCILQSLQGRATCLCTVSDASSPRYPILFKIHFNKIVLLTLCLRSGHFLQVFLLNPFMHFYSLRCVLHAQLLKQDRFFFFTDVISVGESEFASLSNSSFSSFISIWS
jgi:hypothetical protein